MSSAASGASLPVPPTVTSLSSTAGSEQTARPQPRPSIQFGATQPAPPKPPKTSTGGGSKRRASQFASGDMNI
jgi:hypothetical protein